MTIASNLEKTLSQIIDAERQYGRKPGSVQLIAVSKMRAVEEMRAAFQAGQRDFAENYVQEACEKQAVLRDLPIIWHFIGTIQSNKTKWIANHFDWVQTVASMRVAKRLHEQRHPGRPPLNILIQVNISQDVHKSGIELSALRDLAHYIAQLPRLRLRGLMTIPAETVDSTAQLAIFRQMETAFLWLQREGFAFDTLSMGMSQDFIPAIQAGSTMVRLGTALFGRR